MNNGQELRELGPLVEDNLRLTPDFPEPGVLFRDFTPLLADGESFSKLIRGIAKHYEGKIDAVAGLESRGFLLAAPVAVELGIGTLMVRKAGKLPGPVIGVEYGLEYGKSRMEIQPDSVPEGARVLILDDVLATGGTAAAAVKLIEASGGEVVSICVLMELSELNGRDNLGDLDCQALTVI